MKWNRTRSRTKLRFSFHKEVSENQQDSGPTNASGKIAARGKVNSYTAQDRTYPNFKADMRQLACRK